MFAGTFYNAGDMEGNIATDSFHSDGSDIGDSGNVGQYTERLKIHTTKTVSGLKDTETFKTNNRLGPGYEIRQGNSEGLGEMAEKSGNYTELHFL